MKKIIGIIGLVCLATFTLNAQHKQFKRVHEVGFGIGASNYTGDLAENLKLKYSKPAGNFFYRYNFPNEVSVLRANFLAGKLGVNELKSPEPQRSFRGLGFDGMLMEFSMLYEYDFFNFRDIDGKYFMSPYLFGGLGITTFSGAKNTATYATLPFGTGLKFRLSGGWNLGLEAGARKNFTDKIDGFTNQDLIGTGIGTDWTYHLGINMSYTFYSLICPEDVKRK
jgi:hypothetical protein